MLSVLQKTVSFAHNGSIPYEHCLRAVGSDTRGGTYSYFLHMNYNTVQTKDEFLNYINSLQQKLLPNEDVDTTQKNEHHLN